MKLVVPEQRESIFETDGLSVISPHSKLSILGISIHYAWIFCLLAPSVMTPGGSYGLNQITFARVGLMLACSLCLLFIWRKSDFFFNKRYLLIALVVLLGSATIWPSLAIIPSEQNSTFYLFWVLAGVGYACSIALWSEMFSSIDAAGVRAYISIGIVFGAILCALITLVIKSYAGVIASCLPFAEAITIVLLENKFDFLKNRMFVPGKESDARMNINWRPILSVVASNLAFGFILHFLFTQEGGELFPLIAYMLAAAIAGIVVIVDFSTRRFINEDFIIKIFLPTAAIGLIPLAFTGTTVRIICCGLMIFGLTLQSIMSTSSLCGHARVYKLSPMRVFCFGRSFAVFGFLIGWAISYFATLYSTGYYFIAVVSIILIAVFIFVSSFVMKNYYPNEDEGKGSSEVVHTQHARSQKQTAKLGFDEVDKRDIWKKKREKLAHDYNLSPRQEEVLALLAKGHDTKYIEDKLYISNHTAKSHIYAIYQKLDVHSRQDLIELIDKTKV
ncbi:MAG: hypothetical protein HGA54_08300 [Actinobacteria bacterium]|nr:hypothetical protein [Actinomycetota bacterium]